MPYFALDTAVVVIDGPSGSTESWAKSYCCRLARKAQNGCFPEADLN
jgi:hypothetical protein